MKLRRTVIIYIIFIAIAICFHFIIPTPWTFAVVTVVEFMIKTILEKIFKKPNIDAEKLGKVIVRETQKIKKQTESQQKLKNHCQEILHVFEDWSFISVNEPRRVKGFIIAKNPLYLATWSAINARDTLGWAMEHVNDKEGYPKLKRLLKKLEKHEKKHNESVSSLLKRLDEKAISVLKGFPNLKEKQRESNLKNNFCYMEKILDVLHNPNFLLQINEERKELYYFSSTIAKSDIKTVVELKGEIEKIRAIHKKDFEKINADIEKDEQLLNKSKKIVKDIIYKVAKLDKTLKGKCDYERGLDSKN